jgi:hypothetical protein
VLEVLDVLEVLEVLEVPGAGCRVPQVFDPRRESVISDQNAEIQ